MAEIESCKAMIKELLPGMSEGEQAAILDIAIDTFSENPDLSLTGMVQTLCELETMKKVIDEKQINEHQRSVLFGGGWLE